MTLQAGSVIHFLKNIHYKERTAHGIGMKKGARFVVEKFDPRFDEYTLIGWGREKENEYRGGGLGGRPNWTYPTTALKLAQHDNLVEIFPPPFEDENFPEDLQCNDVVLLSAHGVMLELLDSVNLMQKHHRVPIKILNSTSSKGVNSFWVSYGSCYIEDFKDGIAYLINGPTFNVSVGRPSCVTAPKNNDGRLDCFWCGSKTRRIDGGFSFMDVCTGCGR